MNHNGHILAGFGHPPFLPAAPPPFYHGDCYAYSASGAQPALMPGAATGVDFFPPHPWQQAAYPGPAAPGHPEASTYPAVMPHPPSPMPSRPAAIPGSHELYPAMGPTTMMLNQQLPPAPSPATIPAPLLSPTVFVQQAGHPMNFAQPQPPPFHTVETQPLQGYCAYTTPPPQQPAHPAVPGVHMPPGAYQSGYYAHAAHHDDQYAGVHQHGTPPQPVGHHPACHTVDSPPECSAQAAHALPVHQAVAHPPPHPDHNGGVSHTPQSTIMSKVLSMVATVLGAIIVNEITD